MKDLTDFGFVLGMNFFPIFDFSLCFYASYILSSPEATFVLFDCCRFLFFFARSHPHTMGVVDTLCQNVAV